MKSKSVASIIFTAAALALFAVSGLTAQIDSAAPEEKIQKADTPAASLKNNWPAHLRLLTGPYGGQWFMLGEPIVEVLTKRVLPTTSRMGGGVSNIANINAKLGDIGFTLACFMGAAQSGELEYQHIKTDNVALVANVYPQVLYFLMRKDFAAKHNIDSVETLLRKKMPLRFASLKPGTASEFILTLLLRHGYNSSFEQLRENGWSLYFNNYSDAADNFVSGDIDCFAYTAGTTVPLILTIEEHVGIVVLPLEQDVLDLLAKKFQTHTYVIQPGIYKSVTAPVKTLGDFTSIIARKDLPDDLIFAVTKALWENKDALAKEVKDFGALSPDTALPAGLPAHPGSTAYWNSILKK